MGSIYGRICPAAPLEPPEIPMPPEEPDLTAAASLQAPEPSRLTACLIGDGSRSVWYEASGARLRRSLAQAGVTAVVPEESLSGCAGQVILLRTDAVYDPPVIRALLQQPGVALLSGEPQSGVPLAAHAPKGSEAAAYLRGERPLPGDLKEITTGELGAAYWHALRKRETPYAMLLSGANQRQIEWRMFMGTYKGATDFITKWLWPRPAFHVTRLAARWGLTPNFITSVSLLAVIAAFFWFLQGNWAAGLAAAWLMTFLDTVDGKLARVTLKSSKWGNVFDHGIDLIHPPFWYVAWGLGLQAGPLALTQNLLVWSLAVIIGGYVLQRAIEGLSIWLFKIEIHVWRPIDTLFRQVTARRNPNLALLTLGALAGRPDLDWSPSRPGPAFACCSMPGNFCRPIARRGGTDRWSPG